MPKFHFEKMSCVLLVPYVQSLSHGDGLQGSPQNTAIKQQDAGL